MFRSEYADIQPVDLPIHDAVLGHAADHGDTPALIDGVEGTTLTYAQLDLFHRRLAAALTEAGLRKGDVLALHSPNTIAYPTAFYAATRAGATVTTAHPLATAEEFAKQLTDSGARWIITVSPLLDTARAAAERAGGVREILVCDSAPGHRSLIDLLGTTAPEPVVDIDPATDLAVLPYSSGTTGVPKGVMLTHRSIATNLAQLEPVMPAAPGDRVLAVLPFFHIYGLTALMNAPLRRGATVVVLPRFDLEVYLAAIEKHRITHLYVAPPIVLALAKHPAAERYDLSSVRHVLSAAAPLDARLAAACSARLGLPPVVQGYGMTELSPCSHLVPLDQAAAAPPGTVGKLIAGTEMRIVSLDDPAEDVPVGEPGEVLIRGPQVMKGYLGRPDATAAMIDADGWLATGDIAHCDADGWLHVVDRVKELIKYKGFQVAPAELEALLVTHPGIADAAVIGRYNDDGNEVPHAFVVPHPTTALTEADVMMYVAERVAPYKRVRHVTFVDGVPRAASGKILRRELRERL
ncbi:4-coumarate--CoA ligase family protein [Streptomyces heilongjiangensis]|uniref:4-coumarate--CoA ligase family protein n=1 Tax=Streptomyces heilongjiangensis TaxID=945052 RepID=A0ABW1B3P3_9ACTN|nr:4-coumarate--CoA ligase family protein [Streptomyces heilongjiangensis]MDC2946846.1 4-coumarate--CoA ligase family protein [Streptomyces heilongjiangensis]